MEDRSRIHEVTKDTLIGQVLDTVERCVQFFLEMGMHCLGCPASRGESLEQACLVHGIEVEELVDSLNQHMAE